MPLNRAIQKIPKNIRLFIFDVDGTLYDQNKLRQFMLRDLLKYYLVRPFKIKELYILHAFRKLREKYAGYCSNDLNEEQYLWCAKQTQTEIENVKHVVEKWIYNEPIKYLKKCMYPCIKTLFNVLNKKGILVAVYSDYPVDSKLNAMKLSTHLAVTSTDTQIGCFKPDPKGINYICATLAVSKENAVFIGDRYSRDGLCAVNASVPFILIPKTKAKAIVKINNLIKQVNNV